MALQGKSLYQYCLEHKEVRHLLDEFDYERNKLTPEQIYYNSTKDKVWWYCKKHDYHWQAYISPRVNHPNTPCCNGRVASNERNLALEYPELVLDWDYANNIVLPEQLLPGSHKMINWKCHKCGFRWQARLDSRALHGSDCPNCSKSQTSLAERALLSYIKRTFPNATHQKQIKQNNVVMTPELDIIIPEIRIAIEYDGYPWHIDKIDQHIAKLNYCTQNGYILINIAEYKDNETLIQVQNQYTQNHRVLYYQVTSTYNIKDLLDTVYKYFLANGINLGIPTDDIKTDIKKELRTAEIEDSLWNDPDLQWLHYWITDPESIQIAKAYKTNSLVASIKLTCPDCGRIIERNMRLVARKFVGCVRKSGGCGSKRFIPPEHLKKVKGINEASNNRPRR